MLSLILPLSDLQATLEAVGGKGMSLAKLSRAGLPVPGGSHVTTDAYRRFVSINGLQPQIGGAQGDRHDADNQPRYVIPAVLGTGSATRRIHTGQIITVDGTAGRVILGSERQVEE